jgi:hypothetical protein
MPKRIKAVISDKDEATTRRMLLLVRRHTGKNEIVE